MKLILARHGNTFEGDMPVVWVGRANDLPLVEKGRKQADTLGKWLTDSALIPQRIFAAPLQRTQGCAEIVRICLDNAPAIENDERLLEIDYGNWAGLTTTAIIERYGAEAIEGWNTHSIWPQSAGWSPAEDAIKQGVKAFAQMLADEYANAPDTVILLVSSNGVLRYFLDLIPGEYTRRAARGAVKMKTGNVSLMQYDGGRWSLAAWNVTPCG